jgi:hypothetical protein
MSSTLPNRGHIDVLSFISIKSPIRISLVVANIIHDIHSLTNPLDAYHIANINPLVTAIKLNHTALNAIVNNKQNKMIKIIFFIKF